MKKNKGKKTRLRETCSAFDIISRSTCYTWRVYGSIEPRRKLFFCSLCVFTVSPFLLFSSSRLSPLKKVRLPTSRIAILMLLFIKKIQILIYFWNSENFFQFIRKRISKLFLTNRHHVRCWMDITKANNLSNMSYQNSSCKSKCKSGLKIRFQMLSENIPKLGIRYNL